MRLIRLWDDVEHLHLRLKIAHYTLSLLQAHAPLSAPLSPDPVIVSYSFKAMNVKFIPIYTGIFTIFFLLSCSMYHLTSSYYITDICTIHFKSVHFYCAKSQYLEVLYIVR